MNAPTVQFLADYAQHRAAEGRGYSGNALRALPYLAAGPFAKQWAVRARSFDAFVKTVVHPMVAVRGRPLEVLDLGAGNGWLSQRIARMGHGAVAVDIRDDDVDGLGAAAEFLRDAPGLFERIVASFNDLPLESGRFDIVLFNASLHYAKDLASVLREATRVTRSTGVVVILDSPFYAREEDGAAMVAEKHAQGEARFGNRAGVLLAQDFIEYLTRERLDQATPRLVWTRRRVRYPFWYEMRPFQSWLKGKRPPSRFDLWLAVVP
ncbi:MAG TPA: class I SAM-dependent methyltransferase [Rhizomicrobium sp.]|jgi:SAM-dependent methyltransferase